jgi:hypothetical protein
MTCSDLTQIAPGCDGGLQRRRPDAHGQGWFFTGRGGNPPGAAGAPGAPPCIIRLGGPLPGRGRAGGGFAEAVAVGCGGVGGAVCAGGGGGAGAATTDGAGRGGGVADTTGGVTAQATPPRMKRAKPSAGSQTGVSGSSSVEGGSEWGSVMIGAAPSFHPADARVKRIAACISCALCCTS